MNKLSVCCMLLLPLLSSAQKKLFSFNEIFGNEFPPIFKALPQVQGWVDDEHYIELRDDGSGGEKAVSVHVLTGKATPYSDKSTPAATPPEIDSAENVTLSPDGKYAAYTKRNNLYLFNIASKTARALTRDGTETILNGYASWLYYEEILGRASRYKAFWWSPDSRSIAFMRFDDSQVPRFPIYFADGQHGYLEQEHYPKAGNRNPEVKIGVISIDAGKTTWADFDAARDQYFGPSYWTPANELLVQWMNREQDSLLVYRIDKNNGGKSLVYTETQPTWIALDESERFFFLPSGKGMIIKSDKDGWENLYLYDAQGRFMNAITTGNFWGTTILHVDEKNGQVLVKARKENSARFDIYKISLSGKSATRLSFGSYSHDDVNVSPGGKYIITTYSNLSAPPAMALLDSKGKIIRNLGDVRGRSFDNYQLPVTKMITVKSFDGLFDLPMTITYPVNFDPGKKYPVWISVYGGPNAGTVFDRWKPAGGFTQWWSQEGIVQVAMDNRSSGHFGKKGMNYIFRQMGKWEIEDYMSCGRWLRAQGWADSSRIGINGGSFGGYITCLALTYGASVFTHGISSYPVVDWRLYDSHYTERFMNLPSDNEEGYKNTSVLNYIDRYKGLLRIVHGTTDDNVHMQNTIQLVNALEMRNKHFELMLYPNQRHGIRGDKFAHSIGETCRFVYRYLLNRDLPVAFGQ